MLAAMYLRKSRAEENESVEFTLSRHKDTLTHFAETNDITVKEVYEEVVSGDSLFKRPAMLRLLDNIERYEAILCMDIDRLGRGNMKEQGIILEAIKNADVKIITPRKVYDLNNELDETYSEFQAFMARQELKLIKSRMQRGLRKSAEEGSHLGPPPYGYENVRIGKRTTLKIIPNEAEIVKLIYDMYLSGKGVNLIASTLNDMSIKPQRIKLWSRVTVRRILQNDVYAGRITYGKLMKSKRAGIKKEFRPSDQRIMSDGLHEAIISIDTYEKVQKIMTEKYRPPTSDYGVIKNPFAGVIKCMQCGRALELHPYKGYNYLLCKTKGCVRMANLEYIEAAFLNELSRHLDELVADANSTEESADMQEVICSMEVELEKVRSQQERLHDLLEQGAYTIEMFKQRNSVLIDRIKQLEVSLDEERKKSASRRNRVSIIIPRIQDILRFYNDGTPREKNELIKAVVSRVLYFKEKDAQPADFSLLLEFIAAE